MNQVKKRLPNMGYYWSSWLQSVSARWMGGAGPTNTLPSAYMLMMTNNGVDPALPYELKKIKKVFPLAKMGSAVHMPIS
jgi:hypothetical protein